MISPRLFSTATSTGVVSSSLQHPQPVSVWGSSYTKLQGKVRAGCEWVPVLLVPLTTIKYLPKDLVASTLQRKLNLESAYVSQFLTWQAVSLLLWFRSEVQPAASQWGRVLQQQPPREQLHGDHPNHPASGFSPWTGAQPEPAEHRHEAGKWWILSASADWKMSGHLPVLILLLFMGIFFLECS